MPFHNLPKEFRKAVKININNKYYDLKEVYDIKCCFVQLSALLAINQLDPNDINYNIKLEQFNNVKYLANNDIYTEILNYINDKNLTRTDIKKYIMFWLFSRDYQRTNVSKSNIIINRY